MSDDINPTSDPEAAAEESECLDPQHVADEVREYDSKDARENAAWTIETLASELTRLCAQVTKLTPGTIAYQSHLLGIYSAEPLIVAFDSLLRYAKAHKARFDSPLADDSVLGPPWLEAVKGLRALLNGDGAVANELGCTTDSKDNCVCEAMFWAALEAAGFTEETVNL